MNFSGRCGMISQNLAPMITPGTEPIQIGNTKLQFTVPNVRCPRDVKINKIAA